MKKGTMICYFLVCFILTGCSTDEKDSIKRSEKGMSTLKQIEGTWDGVIVIPNNPLSITLHFKYDSGAISIPAQGLNNYPLSKTELIKSNLLINMEIQGQIIAFNGKVDNEKIGGTFVQQGQSFPFELRKTNGIAAKDSTEEDLVSLEVNGGTMYGKLELPIGSGPFPVMIILAGSGPTDKDGNSPALAGKNNSYKMLAESLAASGIASIRYDKRGIGRNVSLGKKEEDLRFEDYIRDAESWVQFTKSDNRFSKIGIIGHSEGSLIGLAAANQEPVDLYISLAGAGRTIDKILKEQLEGQLPPQLLKESNSILAQLKEGKLVPKVSTELQSLYRSSVQPYMISWLKYDPTKILKELNCPVLIVNGNHDIQVPISDAALLHQAKKDSELLIIEKMNHILKESPEDREGNIATYSNPNLPISNELFIGIMEFLKESNIVKSY